MNGRARSFEALTLSNRVALHHSSGLKPLRVSLFATLWTAAQAALLGHLGSAPNGLSPSRGQEPA